MSTNIKLIRNNAVFYEYVALLCSLSLTLSRCPDNLITISKCLFTHNNNNNNNNIKNIENGFEEIRINVLYNFVCSI